MIATELIPYIELRDGFLAQMEQLPSPETIERVEFMNILVAERLLVAIGFEPEDLQREKELCALVNDRIAARRSNLTTNGKEIAA